MKQHKPNKPNSQLREAVITVQELTAAMRKYYAQNNMTNSTVQDILNHVEQRLIEKQSITPKQTLWLIENAAKLTAAPIGHKIMEHLLLCMESGGTDEQRRAADAVHEHSRTVTSNNNFNELFYFSDSDLLSEIAARLADR